MSYARRVDANQAEIADALEKCGYRVWLTFRMGRGFPDLLVVSKSHIPVLLEVKSVGKGLNTKEAQFFAAYKAPKSIVRSAEDALSVMLFWDEMEMV